MDASHRIAFAVTLALVHPLCVHTKGSLCISPRPAFAYSYFHAAL